MPAMAEVLSKGSAGIRPVFVDQARQGDPPVPVATMTFDFEQVELADKLREGDEPRLLIHENPNGIGDEMMAGGAVMPKTRQSVLVNWPLTCTCFTSHSQCNSSQAGSRTYYRHPEEELCFYKPARVSRCLGQAKNE